MQTAGWSSAATFAKFYDREMHQQIVRLDQASMRRNQNIVYLNVMRTNQCWADQISRLLSCILLALISIHYGH